MEQRHFSWRVKGVELGCCSSCIKGNLHSFQLLLRVSQKCQPGPGRLLGSIHYFLLELGGELGHFFLLGKWSLFSSEKYLFISSSHFLTLFWIFLLLISESSFILGINISEVWVKILFFHLLRRFLVLACVCHANFLTWTPSCLFYFCCLADEITSFKTPLQWIMRHSASIFFGVFYGFLSSPKVFGLLWINFCVSYDIYIYMFIQFTNSFYVSSSFVKN